jgi:hypothetical protein
MSRKLYGSLNNRVDENKMFCKEIKVGTGMTEYYWSDRHAYEVVKVINQKHVFVREYDHKGIGEPMSNDWELISNPNKPAIEMKFRYGRWYKVHRCKHSDALKRAAELVEDGTCKTFEAAYNYVIYISGIRFKTDEEIEAFKNGKEHVNYYKANVSFGVAEYYYDYEF